MSTKNIFIILFTIFALTNAKFHVRFLKFECETSNITVESFKCYLRAYNRRNPMVNAEFTLKRKFVNLKFYQKIFHKLQIDSKYKLVTQLDNIDVCKVIKGIGESAFMKEFVKWLESIVPDFFSICSRTGTFHFMNISIPESTFIQAAKFNFRITKIECESSNITVTNYKCYLKAYNRRSPAFNVEMFLAKKTENFKCSLYQFYKLNRDENFKLLLKLENLEACKLLTETSENSFTNQVINWFVSVNNKIPFICNSTGQINMNNLTVPDSPFLKVFPAAYYKLIGNLFHEHDENAFKFTFYVMLTK
ncbi:hypothetical protein PVAND_016473 [Polypedilum vanderplanki]|uniref:Uncharacterized protein n=1 Tax=Polypedilum vanderplanki TaxID=319348 RepID=A0A9J6BG07_POLVA|nr:hypothetical protein PVAND_016473 [Polypedilum vanderplanki]